jgi:autotransporter-associated beta strand protein
MNIQNVSGLAALLIGLSTHAATLQEWTFYSDPAGKTLSEAYNSAGTATFDAGGSGSLETDGLSFLRATGTAAGDTGMWTNGAILNASVPAQSSGTVYLRYDFEYDLSDTDSLNDSGCVLGFSFRDATGDKVAGIALQYDVGTGTAPAGLTVTELETGLDPVGSVSVLARVNLGASPTMDVWYDLTGDTSGFTEASPNESGIAINITTIDQLQFQATGDFQPATSTDYAAAGLLRTADDWADALAAPPPEPPAADYLNEWTFERDVAGRPLAETINSGTSSPLAQFTTGFGSTVFTTNSIDTVVAGALRCIGQDGTADGVWTNGAMLDAELTPATTGTHYLRYDVEYSLTNSLNESGTVLGVYFTGDSGDKAAGMVLGYDQGTLQDAAAAAGRTLTPIPGADDLPESGTLSAIAEVDLDNDTLKVWYDLSGENTFQAEPVFTNSITISSLDNLRFHATGDFQPAGSDDYAEVDNIRHAATFAEITEPVADLTADPDLSVTLSDSLSGAMEIGETNLFTAVIENSGGPAAQVSAELTHDGASGAFTVTTNHSATSLPAGGVLTNTFTVVANTKGTYSFTAQALIAGAPDGDPDTLPVVVGSLLSYQTNNVTEISGGTYAGLYEPGETLEIEIISLNDGARPVSNAVNTLTAASAGFTITPASDSYASVAIGQSVTSTYTVVIGNDVASGTYTFNVENSSTAGSWPDSFTLDVFLREPGIEWIKANNSSNLTEDISWLSPSGGVGKVPNNTEIALMNQEVQSDINTALGANLSFGGIALVSNTAAWTISGSNTLSLGSAGIDMAQAQADLTIASGLNLASSQSWSVVTGQTLSVSGTLSGEADEPVLMDGGGTLDLRGTNTFAGGLSVSGSTLSVGSNRALGTGDAQLDDAEVQTSSAATPDNNIELTGNTVFNNANDLTLDGILSGTGSLTKNGGSSLILRGDNTYSGGTILSNGASIKAGSTKALGTGRVNLSSGAGLTASSSVFGFNAAGLINEIEIDGSAVFGEAAGAFMTFDGPINGNGDLALLGNSGMALKAPGSFSGTITSEITTWLRLYDLDAIGTSEFNPGWGVLFVPSGEVDNNINLTVLTRIHLNNQAIELSGDITSSGNRVLVHWANNGTLTLSGDNSNWSGGTFEFRKSDLVLSSPTALGQSDVNIILDGDDDIRIKNTLDLSNPGIGNPMTFGEIFSGAGDSWPVEFDLDHDMKLTGALSGDNPLGLRKSGPAALILAGTIGYSGPTDVRSGTLIIENSTLDSQNMSVASGAKLDLRAAPSFKGDLNTATGSQISLVVNDDNPILSGSGGQLDLAGTMTLDFANYNGTHGTAADIDVGDTFTVINLGSWFSVTDNGLDVLAAGLPPFMTIDDSNLFVDGTVEIVASRLSSQNLTITVPAGGTADGTLTLTNAAGGALNFTLANDGSWPAGDYLVTTQAQSRASFLPAQFAPETVFASWNGTTTDEMEIGFNFGVFGEQYSGFSAGQDGTITLHSAEGETAQIRPYKRNTLVAQDRIRYKKSADQLIVAWDVDPKANGTTGSLQAWINADGSIRYLYATGDWSGGTIGVHNSQRSQTIAHNPGQTGRDSLLLTSSSWVSSNPEEDSINAGGSRLVTFTADASSQDPAETSFIATVKWNDGETSPIGVTIIVTAAAPKLDLPPSPFIFSGRAGQISTALITATNSGDAALTYTISDSDLQAASYTSDTVDYQNRWINIPDAVNYQVPSSDLGSTPVSIGFPFTFFGNTYSNLIVNRDGTLTLESGKTIKAFAAGLSLDGNASIRVRRDLSKTWMAVTWKNMAQPGGGSDQTFQAVLSRNGVIRCNYQSLSGSWPNGTIQITDGTSVVNESLINETTATTTTNYVYETNTVVVKEIGNWQITSNVVTVVDTNVTTTFDSEVYNQSIEFTPGARQIITASPVTGTIAANGGTANITLTGDARSLTGGGPNNVTNSTTLTFTYSGMSDDLGVTFIATNSVESVYAAPDAVAKASMWGTPVVPNVVMSQDSTGARTLSWPAPEDMVADPRTYRVWFTTSLSRPFAELPGAAVTNGYSFTDHLNKEEPVIFYKVTVE